MKAFYTYIWLRQSDLSPYYIGKGHGSRAYTSHSHGVKCPKDRERIIVQHFSSEKEAFAAEIFLIAFYGRRDLGTGRLRNLSDGGENPPNAKGKKRPPRTEQHCRRISEARKKLFAEGKIKPWNEGRPHSESTRAKISAARTGMHSENISRGQIERHLKNPNHLKSISALGTARLQDETVRAKIGASNVVAWEKRKREGWTGYSEEHNRNLSKALTGKAQSEKQMANRRAAFALKDITDPGWRARNMLGRKASPETRAKMSAAHLARWEKRNA
jgi:hypothetical protein